jgi:hypothetical protein
MSSPGQVANFMPSNTTIQYEESVVVSPLRNTFEVQKYKLK